MKKFFFIVILLFISSVVLAKFDPTSDTPPAILPENIHVVTGTNKQFVSINQNEYYHWYVYEFNRESQEYYFKYIGTGRGVANNKHTPSKDGKYMCVSATGYDAITEIFLYNYEEPVPYIKEEKITPCQQDTITILAESVADKLEWVMIKDNIEQPLPQGFNKDNYQIYCPTIEKGKTLFLRNKITYYKEMTLSKNLIENGDFEDASSVDNHYNGFSSSYDFYGLDMDFDPKVLERDENGNITRDTFPGYYRLCTKGINTCQPDATKGGKYFLELDGDSNSGAIAYCAKLKTHLEEGQQYQFSYMAVATSTVNNIQGYPLQEYGKVVFKLKYKDSQGIEHTVDLLGEKEINHHTWETYGEGIYWTATTNCYDAEIILTNNANTFGANDFGVDNIMFQRYYPQEVVVYEDFKITPKECVEEIKNTVKILSSEAPYIWIDGDKKEYSESGEYEYTYKEQKEDGSWYFVTKKLYLTIVPEPTPEPEPEPAPEPEPEPEPTPGPEPEPEPTPEREELKPMKYFSPNNDGVLDLWLIEGIDSYPESTIQIFDRFHRRLLFVKASEFMGWDGIYNDHEMPNDDYWYLIRVPGRKGTTTGHFTLKR